MSNIDNIVNNQANMPDARIKMYKKNGIMMNANMQHLVAFFQNQAMLPQQLQPQEKVAGMFKALAAMQMTKRRKMKWTPGVKVKC